MLNKSLTILVLALIIFAHYPLSAKEYTLSSPDKTIEVKISVEKEISYSLWVESRQITAPSALSLILSDGTVLGKEAQVKSSNMTSVDTIIVPDVKQKSGASPAFLFTGNHFVGALQR